jgi:hypothetical protein
MSGQWAGGKGSIARPRSTGKEERELRHAFAFGFLTKEQFDQRYRELMAEGKIMRDGRVVKG